jgi:transposase
MTSAQKEAPMDLSEKQWEIVGPLIPKPRRREDGKGRPWRDPRDIMNAVLWILRTGAQWEDLPDKYPPKSTCHRRFQQWVKDGVLEKVVKALAKDLKDRGGIDLEECFVDGSFAPAKKGALVLGKQSGERVQRSWRSETLMVFLSPLALSLLRRTK